MNIFLIALNTFRAAIRNRLLYSVLFFTVLLIAVSALFGSVSIGSQINIIIDFGLFSLSFFGAVAATIIGVGLLEVEIKYKTIYNILSKPVERYEFVAGKWLGALMTVYSLMTLMGIIIIAFASIFSGSVDTNLFPALLLSMLEVTVVTSVTVFFSSVVITTTLAGLFTFGFYLAGRSVNYLEYFLSSDSSPLIRQFTGLLSWILPDLTLFDVTSTVVNGQPISFSYLIFCATYAACYSLAALILSCVIFNRRELV
ncbi:MAG: ABC transporter permease subunit [bacterium]|nr:ABC transporter permease subunit [bacterium]